ncbi:hypothetical protein Tco_1280217 [Tanacetum coccineum]
MDLISRVYKPYLDKFIDDISICSSRNEEHEEHLRLILGLLKNKELSFKKGSVKDKNLHGMDKESETRLDRTLCIRSRSKIYHNLKQWYRWSNMEIGIATNVRSARRPAKDNKPLLHDLGNRDHQKNYADVRRKPLEFQVGVGTVAYRLELPKQLSRVDSTFYVSNLKKCMSDETLAIPLDGI